MESEILKKKQKKTKLLEDNQDQSIAEDPWKEPFKIGKTKDGKGWRVPKWMVESKFDEPTILRQTQETKKGFQEDIPQRRSRSDLF